MLYEQKRGKKIHIPIIIWVRQVIIGGYKCASGGMVDALASGASELMLVEVQVLSRAPF